MGHSELVVRDGQRPTERAPHLNFYSVDWPSGALGHPVPKPWPVLHSLPSKALFEVHIHLDVTVTSNTVVEKPPPRGQSVVWTRRSVAVARCRDPRAPVCGSCLGNHAWAPSSPAGIEL